MNCAFVFLAIALQVAFACESGYYGGGGYYGGYPYGGSYYGGGYGYPYGGYGGYGGYGYGYPYGSYSYGNYGGNGGYLSQYTEGCNPPCNPCPAPPRPCEEIVIKEKPGEIRKVVVEEEFLVPVRKQSRPRPLEVVVDAPCDNCAPKAPCCSPPPCPRPCYNPCGGNYY